MLPYVKRAERIGDLWISSVRWPRRPSDSTGPFIGPAHQLPDHLGLGVDVGVAIVSQSLGQLPLDRFILVGGRTIATKVIAEE
jgi:hypothetical protein